ncbi:hypothetical protein DFH08DRAFT_966599 [Mycena albidolilacea]|uniref:Uncharacterized protein n=1 Tax=Mycena albidolilacea TaxID=1033008 RepID=A0AAD6ZMY2_9AGAR|nr:hypothetical protein DFH08DRAFT_966599 [Mycena albidolilacea]
MASLPAVLIPPFFFHSTTTSHNSTPGTRKTHPVAHNPPISRYPNFGLTFAHFERGKPQSCPLTSGPSNFPQRLISSKTVSISKSRTPWACFRSPVSRAACLAHRTPSPPLPAPAHIEHRRSSTPSASAHSSQQRRGLQHAPLLASTSLQRCSFPQHLRQRAPHTRFPSPPASHTAAAR